MASQTINNIAKKIRKWAEQIAKNEGFSNDLLGLCVRASAKLHTKLKHRGYKTSQIYLVHKPGFYNHQHAFVYCAKHYIDVTATQFGVEDKVLIVKNKKDLPTDGWKKVLVTNNVNELKQQQYHDQWPKSQIVD